MEATEIVIYADFPLSFDEAYPVAQLETTIVTYTSVYGTHTYGYDISATTSVLPAGGDLAVAMPDLIGNRIYAVILKSYDGTIYSSNTVLDSVGVCYYVITDYLGSANLPVYFKLTQSDIPIDIRNPYIHTASVVIEGSDIYWLYNFGNYLSGIGTTVDGLLSLNIGGYNLLSLLFGGGFLLYCSWVIFKWVIPF